MHDLHPNIAKLHSKFCNALRIEKPTKPSDWCDQNRILSASATSEPGLWRTSRTPYIREILDQLHPNSSTTRVTLMKGHQIGYTQGILINAIAYTIGHQPRSTLLVTPSQKHTQKIFYQKVEPMIIDSPKVREKISIQSKFANRNTTFHKDFSGGFLSGVGANVASDLAGASVQVLLLDEADRMTFDVEGEGSPVELAVARTAIYRRKKIFMGSTPVDEETSVVYKWFLEGDQRYYHVPCPFCGFEQALYIESLSFKDGKPVYKCFHCGKHIEEKYKTSMLSKGKWIPTKMASNANYVSYHLNSLYSPIGFLSWSDVLASKKRADEDEYYSRSFENLYLGLPSKQSVGDVPIPNILKHRADKLRNKKYKPDMLVTCGVDIQKDRIEALAVGFLQKKMHVLEHKIFWGETLTSDEIWDDLYAMLAEKHIHLMGVDCGYIPHKVFAWQKKYKDRRIKIIKGSNSHDYIVSLPKFMEISDYHKKQKRGNKFYEVATSFLKDEIYARLMIDDPKHDEFIHFPSNLPDEFYAQLCAERKVLKNPDKKMEMSVKGSNKYKWIAIRHRNEVLDMMVYALGMFYFSGAAKGVKNWNAFIERRNSYANRAGKI